MATETNRAIRNVDEAILLAVAAGEAPPTLRFFAWQPPCLSLGFSQPQADVDLDRLQALGWGLVRRPTGGRAILHTDELTYSVIASLAEPRVAGAVVESYRHLSEGLLRGLKPRSRLQLLLIHRFPSIGFSIICARTASSPRRGRSTCTEAWMRP